MRVSCVICDMVYLCFFFSLVSSLWRGSSLWSGFFVVDVRRTKQERKIIASKHLLTDPLYDASHPDESTTAFCYDV